MAKKRKAIIPPVGQGRKDIFMVELLVLALALLLPILIIATHYSDGINISASPPKVQNYPSATGQ